jgi:hypothetical protein
MCSAQEAGEARPMSPLARPTRSPPAFLSPLAKQFPPMRFCCSLAADSARIVGHFLPPMAVLPSAAKTGRDRKRKNLKHRFCPPRWGASPASRARDQARKRSFLPRRYWNWPRLRFPPLRREQPSARQGRRPRKAAPRTAVPMTVGLLEPEQRSRACFFFPLPCGMQSSGQ